MPWNPEIYNQFKTIRYKPFFDLAALLTVESLENQPNRLKCIDLGCGTGEQTSILGQQFPLIDFIGIDSSPEMLSQSKEFVSSNVTFQSQTHEDFCRNNEQYDIIFSNAALQWSHNHIELFTSIISHLQPNGQIAIQMPRQTKNILNMLLLQLAQEEPYQTYLNGYKTISPVLTIDEYTQLLFNNGLLVVDINVMEKVYPIIANDVDTLFTFISGSALNPYIDNIQNQDEKDQFITEFKKRISIAFPTFPAIYPFKRILFYGRKPNLEPSINVGE